jgi:hypothetical protein
MGEDPGDDRLATLADTDFSPHLNEPFRIQGPEATLEGRLVEVTPLGLRSRGSTKPETRAPFSIVFRLPKDCGWPQGIYTVEHGARGRLSILLVPIGPDQEGSLYEAVFG